MSLAHIKSRDTLVTCPYNSSHRITNGRFPTHIIRCRRSHPCLNQQFTHCPFNQSHVFPAIEKSCHIATCPDRVYVERHVLVSENPSLRVFAEVPDYQDDLPKPSEDWDSEVAGPGYDPSKQMNDQAFRNTATFSAMTPAEKKEYRRNQNRPYEDEEQDDGDDTVDSLISSMGRLRMPMGRGMVEQSSPRSSTSQSFVRSDNDSSRMERMLSISRGRGINRLSNNLRPGSAFDSDTDGSQISIVMRGRGRSRDLPVDSRKVGEQEEETTSISNGDANSRHSDASYEDDDSD